MLLILNPDETPEIIKNKISIQQVRSKSFILAQIFTISNNNSVWLRYTSYGMLLAIASCMILGMNTFLNGCQVRRPSFIFLIRIKLSCSVVFGFDVARAEKMLRQVRKNRYNFSYTIINNTLLFNCETQRLWNGGELMVSMISLKHTFLEKF